MGGRIKLASKIRDVLVDRLFTDKQIEKIIPRLQRGLINEPECLAEVIDTWNSLMSSVDSSKTSREYSDIRSVPPVARPPKSSLMGTLKVDMNTILADIEPDLLLFDPEKLVSRHRQIQGLSLAKNSGEYWIMLFNAPRGFYLQDWSDLSKKIYYVEHRLLDYLYDKREQRQMTVHPLIKSAAVTEADYNHIRTRYLFALRCGYKALSHMYNIQTALDRPTLGDVVLSENQQFLSKFAPFCSLEEYSCFANLIKNHDFDEDDSDVIERLAELNSL